MSRLNTSPACAPVNASLPALRLRAHDSEPVWLARPSPYGSFIHTSTPVYPGAPMITYSNSLCREWAAHSLGRRSTAHHYRDRAFPRANRTLKTVNTHNHSATSSTSELPFGAPSLPWQCSVAGAWPAADNGTASSRYNVRPLVLPPPASNAITSCLACLQGPQRAAKPDENH